jgi:uncharacterized protein (TIGR02588 family)
MATSTSTPRERSTAEWVTFACACAVLVVFVGLVVVQMGGGSSPPSPVASVDGPAVERDGIFSVPVTVENRGDATASQVQVQAELVVDAETVSAEQVIDFLAGGETEDLVFTFDVDPSRGELTVKVTSFALP